MSKKLYSALCTATLFQARVCRICRQRTSPPRSKGWRRTECKRCSSERTRTEFQAASPCTAQAIPTPIFILDPPPFHLYIFSVGAYMRNWKCILGGANGVEGQLQPALNQPIETRNHLKKNTASTSFSAEAITWIKFLASRK